MIAARDSLGTSSCLEETEGQYRPGTRQAFSMCFQQTAAAPRAKPRLRDGLILEGVRQRSSRQEPVLAAANAWPTAQQQLMTVPLCRDSWARGRQGHRNRGPVAHGSQVSSGPPTHSLAAKATRSQRRSLSLDATESIPARGARTRGKLSWMNTHQAPPTLDRSRSERHGGALGKEEPSASVRASLQSRRQAASPATAVSRAPVRQRGAM